VITSTSVGIVDGGVRLRTATLDVGPDPGKILPVTTDRAIAILGPLARAATLTATTDLHGPWVIRARIGDDERPLAIAHDPGTAARWIRDFEAAAR
jgi:hypothetical protein